MKIGKTHLKPNKRRKPFFDGLFDGSENAEASFTFKCGACNKNNEINLRNFLREASEWKSSIGATELETINSSLGLPKVGDFYESHDGAQPYLLPKSCQHCTYSQLVYVGFTEVQPTRYIGSLQGIFELAT